MANISIYREAKVGKISSYHHLVCQQDFSNQNEKNNPNKGKSNLMFYIENGEYKYREFYRDGTNQDLMESLKTKELELDKFAREDYKAHKTKEKLANPNKKVRTILQSKNLKKEFVLAIGGDQDIKPSEFANKVIKTVDAVLKEKGLNRENIIGVFVHRDEKGAIHGHVIFNEYSVLHKTTANQLGKPTIPAGATKKQISDIVKKHREEFGKFQDIVAENMGMERGVKGSKAKHLSKAEHFEKKAKEVEQLERTTAKLQKTKEKLEAEIKVNQDINVLINAGRDKSKKEMEEYQLQAKKAALELTKLTNAVDSTKTELDALHRSKNDVQLQKLSIDEVRHRAALFTIAMNLQPEAKKMEFIGNRAKETDNLMQDYGRFYDMNKPNSEPSFDKMVEDVKQANIAIQDQAKLNDMEELTIE